MALTSRLESDGRAQRFHLASPQRAVRSRFEIAQLQWPDAHALQAFDRAADRRQHATHLALATFDEHHAQHAAVRAATNDRGADGSRGTVFEHDASTQPVHQAVVQLVRKLTTTWY